MKTTIDERVKQMNGLVLYVNKIIDAANNSHAQLKSPDRRRSPQNILMYPRQQSRLTLADDDTLVVGHRLDAQSNLSNV